MPTFMYIYMYLCILSIENYFYQQLTIHVHVRVCTVESKVFNACYCTRTCIYMCISITVRLKCRLFTKHRHVQHVQHVHTCMYLLPKCIGLYMYLMSATKCTCTVHVYMYVHQSTTYTPYTINFCAVYIYC